MCAEGEEAEVAVEEDAPKEKKKFKKVVKVKCVIKEKGVSLDGDALTPESLNLFYLETISGEGGRPKGFLGDLMLQDYYQIPRNFLGYPRYSRDFTGPDGQPCEADYERSWENFKTVCKEGKPFVGKDDRSKWMWLTACQNPGGLFLILNKAPPFGERPLALIKRDNPEEFFEKVNWYWPLVRLHKWNLWGGKAKTFPYPTPEGYWRPTYKQRKFKLYR